MDRIDEYKSQIDAMLSYSSLEKIKYKSPLIMIKLRERNYALKIIKTQLKLCIHTNKTLKMGTKIK
jgi:hypothetical protein